MHELSQLKRAVGSTYSFDTIHLADDDLSDTTSPEHHEVEHMDVQQIHDSLYQHSKEGTINVDDIMVSAIHAGHHQSVKSSHLAKIWHIDKNTAKTTLDIIWISRHREVLGLTIQNSLVTMVPMTRC